jgi:hypothetical protein
MILKKVPSPIVHRIEWGKAIEGSVYHDNIHAIPFILFFGLPYRELECPTWQLGCVEL